MLPKNKGRLEISISSSKDKGAPDFFVNYTKLSDDLKHESYKLINKLVGDNDIILHVYSALFSCPENKRADIALKFISDIKSYGLQYRYRKTRPTETSFASKLFSFGNKEDVHDTLVYIPNCIWQEEGFRNIIPIQGIRYYIIKPGIDAFDIIEKMYSGCIQEHEYGEFSSSSVFDLCCFGNMGVFIKDISLEEVRQLLG